MTGFIGTAWISAALSNAGHTDLAYRLLLNASYPSWLYAVDQGATTIWERLNGYTVENGFGGNNSMNSFNHYSFGAVGQWMIAHSLGIQRETPGFKTFLLKPEPDPTGRIDVGRRPLRLDVRTHRERMARRRHDGDLPDHGASQHDGDADAADLERGERHRRRQACGRRDRRHGSKRHAGHAVYTWPRAPTSSRPRGRS